MSNTNNVFTRYYLFSSSNFLAAIGGGVVLGKGIGTLNIPYLQGSSILAFFVGTVFGLMLLQFSPKKFANLFSRWFSICGGLTSLILLGIFLSYADNEKLSGTIAIIFFVLLSLRFGFWFYSRVLRAAIAAGQQQNIAWVEFGYYAGVIVGLVLWIFLGIDFGLAFALIIDAVLQVSAGLLDLLANRLPEPVENTSPSVSSVKNSNDYVNASIWRLAIAVMFLTIGVQVIIFNIAHHVSDYLSPFILASFYLGVAISAVLCKRFNIRLEWNAGNRDRRYAMIHFGLLNKNKLSFLSGAILAGLSVAMVVLTALYWRLETVSSLGAKEFFILSFILIATFLYGILELAIIDRIGLEEKNTTQSGMVLRTYGLMSIAAVVSLWLLETTKSSLLGLSLTLGICFLLTVVMIRKRKSYS